MMARARELLSGNCLLGYELEDGAIGEKVCGRFIKQFLVRPISKEAFEELWQHGKTHCSKFVIYIKSDDVFVCRRPDMLNYATDDDYMYGQENLIAAARAYNDATRTDLRYTEEYFADNVTAPYKAQLDSRIEYALQNLVEIAKLSDDRYNIRFAEY